MSGGSTVFFSEERRGEERREEEEGFVIVGEASCYSRLRMANTSFLPSVRDICSLDCAPFPPPPSRTDPKRKSKISLSIESSVTRERTFRTFVTVQRASFELGREKREEGEEKEKEKKKDDR